MVVTYVVQIFTSKQNGRMRTYNVFSDFSLIYAISNIMADENENIGHKPSSLEIIGKVWSSLTSNEEPSDETENTSSNGNEENTSGDSTEADENEDKNDENSERRESIFSSIFSRLSSTVDNTENDSSDLNINENESKSSSDENVHDEDALVNPNDFEEGEADSRDRGSLGIISGLISSLTSGSMDGKNDEDIDLSDQQDASERVDTERTEIVQEEGGKHLERSFSIVSDIISSFTSSSSTDKDEQSLPDEVDDLEKSLESTTEDCDEVFQDSNDENTGENDDSLKQRVRSSSSALYTQPESIDKKDLDYVTLVSS